MDYIVGIGLVCIKDIEIVKRERDGSATTIFHFEVGKKYTIGRITIQDNRYMISMLCNDLLYEFYSFEIELYFECLYKRRKRFINEL